MISNIIQILSGGDAIGIIRLTRAAAVFCLHGQTTKADNNKYSDFP
jgi:hypothetical protein